MKVSPDERRLKGNFVLLKADTLQLLLPQNEVGTAEFLSGTAQPTGEPGLFEVTADEGSQLRYVAALSARMDLLDALPPNRFTMTSFPAQEGVSLCWDEVKVLINTELAILPLPTVMLNADSPVTEYVELGDDVAFLCTADQLMARAFGVRT